MSEPESQPASPPLSKRAARRLIQRAWVLAGRDRKLRQHIRELNLITVWQIEDWEFAWTVFFARGRIEFDRRPAKKPHAVFAWPSAGEFFARIERGGLLEQGAASEASNVRFEGHRSAERVLEPVFRVFTAMLREVLQNPFDENGDPLV
ncbi:MAG TPA: hypothetical protein VKU44_07165 [Terriglobia bacterium]|nr:hypothetical protein [Terriglobia bacterium]